MLNNKTLLITGGTGSLGKALTKHILNEYPKIKKIVIFSRCEVRHSEVLKLYKDDERIRSIIGDIKDEKSIIRASRNVDFIIHTAALKRVEMGEYNPMEFVSTNVFGTINVINAAIINNIKKLIFISTDKSVKPTTTYGMTKALAEKLILNAHKYSKNHKLIASCCRYGNVWGSRGSVIPLFKDFVKDGIKKLPVTDTQMTRFTISMNEAIELVMYTLKNTTGSQIYVPKIPSYRITDLVEAFGCEYYSIGIRENEKMHEVMINEYEKRRHDGKYYVIDEKGTYGNDYSSDKNEFLSVDELKEMINYDDNK